MTLVDRPAFAGLVLRVCSGRMRTKLPTDDEIDALFSLANDLTFEEFERGLLAAARSEKFYLDLAVIRRCAGLAGARDRQAQRHVRPEVAAALAGGESHCPECDDSGWAYTKGRHGPRVSLREAVTLGAHAWAVRCACRGMNPLFQAKWAQHASISAASEREASRGGGWQKWDE